MFKTIAKAIGFGLTAAFIATGVAHAQQKLVFATNWRAQGSHGGFYQAIADGTYKRYGLDVQIMQGGPQVNARPLLMVGKVDVLMSQSTISALEANASKMPTTVVAAFMQKDATSLMAHAGQYKSFEDLSKAKTVFVAKASQFGFWKWLTASKGFSDAQFRPYNYSSAPFLADKMALQQAYVTAEPLYLEMQGVKTDVFLLADLGYEAYANMIEVRRETIERNPEMVQKFIDASAIGWYNFLYGGDRSGAYALITKDNPEMTEAKMEAEVGMLMKKGLIDSGDALTKGLGTVSAARLKRFHDEMVKAGVIAAGGVDLDTLVTERFVNKGVGLDLRAKLVKK